MHTENRFVLTLECENRVGIVYAVARFLAERGCNIVDSQQFDAKRENRFYMRVEAERPSATPLDRLREEFAGTASEFGMQWFLGDAGQRMRTIIMVSRTDHCVNELLDLWQSDLLNIDVAAIVGNHDALRPIAERAGVPFHHIPVTAETKPAAEAALLALIERTGAELVVLARYMQILSDELCARLPGRIINIHHSFLPGFKGARPYHQAFERGVKVIGATAHYVTADLDEGPIIEQSVFRVDHRATPEDLTVAGRRAERAALAQAVAWHSERRIFVDGLRTVVFP
ncbi:formyltetrahydrofolate deformylase [Leucobacter sp. CSA1]|uniref:Formyltetrahydrofolate deformylase n=1 Tax=Leucobacter chromiisoli TaxID=2796471 RepID=A0A934UTB8_9MICO|nr:formyltetrahydrofolate deformylase [Leucobacter chromiisoli]MBK0417560.1 formyltetrahydrofolate deformylase [Leucobacter chromiisoli]